jgi:hypothetical protein
LLSGKRSLLHIGGLGHLARLTAAGARDTVRVLRAAAPYRVPAVGEPGSLAVSNSPDAAPGFAAITPPARLGATRLAPVSDQVEFLHRHLGRPAA